MTLLDPAPVGGLKLTPPPTVLRSPADADNFRVKVGRYGDRWYTDPLPPCDIYDGSHGTEAIFPSVSTIKKASGRDWSYVSMKRIAHAGDLIALARLEPAERYDHIKLIDKADKEKAFARGSNVHLCFEARLYGQPIPIRAGDPGWEYLTAVDGFFEAHQPELVAAEFVCIHRSLNGAGFGGTADAIVDIDGKRYIVDWKSRGADSPHGAYPEEAGQLGGYARSDYIIVERDGRAVRERMPHLDGGLIVSIRPDGCDVYPVDLDMGMQHFTAMHAWWLARQDERLPVGRKWAPAKAAPAPTPAPWPNLTPQEQQQQLDLLDGDGHPDEGAPADPDAVTALKARYLALPDVARSWVGGIAAEAKQARRPFGLSPSEPQTVRRFEIMRGLVILAEAGVDDPNVVRAIAAYELDSDAPLFPSVTVGAGVGALGWGQATSFARRCRALTEGDYAVTDGTPLRLHPAV